MMVEGRLQLNGMLCVNKMRWMWPSYDLVRSASDVHVLVKGRVKTADFNWHTIIASAMDSLKTFIQLRCWQRGGQLMGALRGLCVFS